MCIKHKHLSITFFMRCQIYKNYLLREGFVASAGKQVFLMFLYPLGNGHNQIGCLNGGGLTQKKHIFRCKMHSFKTMVVMRFKLWQIPRKKHPRKENKIYFHFEALGATEYVYYNIKRKITVDKFGSCTSHKQYIVIFFVANITEN